VLIIVMMMLRVSVFTSDKEGRPYVVTAVCLVGWLVCPSVGLLKRYE